MNVLDFEISNSRPIFKIKLIQKSYSFQRYMMLSLMLLLKKYVVLHFSLIVILTLISFP